MTLILALKCSAREGEGVLVTADSKATTYGGLAYRIQKIFPIALNPGTDREVAIAVAAGAGNEAMVRTGIGLAEEELLRSATEEWKGGYPSFKQFKYAIDRVEDKLLARREYWTRYGLKPDFNLVLCGVSSDGRGSMYVFDDLGLARPVHDTPGFACIGSGFVTGGNLILQQFWRETLTPDWGAKLAAYVINIVSRVDTQVGPFEGESWYFRVEDKKPVLGKLKIEATRDFLEKVDLREEILKTVWNRCDLIGEEDVLKRLKEVFGGEGCQKEG